jgi:hypothetical protein
MLKDTEIKRLAAEFLHCPLSAVESCYSGLDVDYRWVVVVDEFGWQNFVQVNRYSGKCELVHVR